MHINRWISTGKLTGLLNLPESCPGLKPWPQAQLCRESKPGLKPNHLGKHAHSLSKMLNFTLLYMLIILWRHNHNILIKRYALTIQQ